MQLLHITSVVCSLRTANRLLVGPSVQPLWRDVLRVHSAKPLHVMVGGGDQLYNDDVWKTPSLQEVSLLSPCLPSTEFLVSVWGECGLAVRHAARNLLM